MSPLALTRTACLPLTFHNQQQPVLVIHKDKTNTKNVVKSLNSPPHMVIAVDGSAEVTHCLTPPTERTNAFVSCVYTQLVFFPRLCLNTHIHLFTLVSAVSARALLGSRERTSLRGLTYAVAGAAFGPTRRRIHGDVGCQQQGSGRYGCVGAPESARSGTWLLKMAELWTSVLG